MLSVDGEYFLHHNDVSLASYILAASCLLLSSFGYLFFVFSYIHYTHNDNSMEMKIQCGTFQVECQQKGNQVNDLTEQVCIYIVNYV